MDPYREKNPLDAIQEQLHSVLDELKRLQPVKASPIREAIANKIKGFDLWESLAKYFLLLFLGAVAILIGCFLVMPHPMISCEFDIRTGNVDPGVYVTVNKDWHPDDQWGPFTNLKEAHDYAKFNNCPNLTPFKE
jgi:hypothetical protein